MPKTEARKFRDTKYRKPVGDPSLDYTGPQQFTIECTPVADRELSLPVGPRMKTQQWQRTLKK